MVRLCNDEIETIKIFDLLGKEIATLVNEKLNAGGVSANYIAKWNGNKVIK